VLFKAHEKAQDTVPAGPVLEPTHALLTEGGADALVLIPGINDVRLINQTAQNSKKSGNSSDSSGGLAGKHRIALSPRGLLRASIIRRLHAPFLSKPFKSAAPSSRRAR
jgi:hypothetical protein